MATKQRNKTEIDLLEQMISVDKKMNGLTESEMRAYYNLATAYGKQNCYMSNTVVVNTEVSM